MNGPLVGSEVALAAPFAHGPVVVGDRTSVVGLEDAYAEVTADVPLRRPSTPEEIAGTIAWLLSADASYVNGAVIPVDGGHTTVDVATTAFGKVA